MKLYHPQKVRFVAKSFLWSLGLYILCMTIINWDEVSSSSRNNRSTIPITQVEPQPANNPNAETRPLDPQSSLSGFAHAIHSTGIFFSQLIKVTSVFRK
jgi:hypothetical protein